MANIKGLVSQFAAAFGSDGDYKYARMLRDGSLSIADFRFLSVMAGRGFMINQGAFSTPETGGGNGTIVDADQPEMIVSVPDGITLIPIRCEISALVPLMATDEDEAEIILAVDQDKAHDATGTCDTEPIYNMNTLKGVGSSCKATGMYTANATAPVLDLELAHEQLLGDVQGTAACTTWTRLHMLYEPNTPPIINGPAMVVAYWGGTVAVDAFNCFQWLEYPTSFFTT